MDKKQKKILLTLAGLGLLYFVLFIFPNLRGAQDANMLSVFEVDEYAQYPHVIGMLTPGATLYQTVRNFLIYLHYFYGYPFYFLSALAIAPIKHIYGAGWTSRTALIVADLRQVINVLPVILAALLLVYINTRLRRWALSIGLFLLLLLLPAVVVNDLWWHPDSLGVLFVALALFFLDRDNLRFGRNFFLAAAVCGVAVGTKYLGVFFFLAIALYLIWGIVTKKISWLRAAGMGALFVVVMAAAVVISNPLLLLPQERAEVIATQRWQFEQTTVGIIMTNTEPYFKPGSYPQDFRIHYGELIFLILVLAALVLGIVRRQRRLYNALILAWIIPVTYTINYSATRRTHYFLPVMLPLIACLVNFFPAGEAANELGTTGGKLAVWLKRSLPWAVGALVIVQAAVFLNADYGIYRGGLLKEQNSPSIAFYLALEKDWLSRLPGQKLVVYRDWHMYFPQDEGKRVEIDWDLPNYDYFKDLNPDLLLLEQVNIQSYSSDEAVKNAVNPEAMQLAHNFYRDAALNQVAGYRILFQNKYGLALIRESLYQKLNAQYQQ
jgi:4-amino-4-deoxy-L-arabinose transferase-like glycosyltransferase